MRLDSEQTSDDFETFSGEFEVHYDAFGTIDESVKNFFERDTEELEDITSVFGDFENFGTEEEF